MLDRRTLSLSSALLVLSLSLLALAQEKPAVDLYGDPLPAGALARLGTVRLRPGDDFDCFAVSPDSKTLVTGERLHIRFWELATGKEIRVMELAGAYAIISLSYSPDGRRLLALVDRQGDTGDGRENFSVYVVDVATSKVLHQFQSDPVGFGYVTFSPDGRFLIANKWLGFLRAAGKEDVGPGAVVLDLSTGKPWLTFDDAWECELSPNGETLAVAEKDGTVSLWNHAQKRKWFSFRAHQAVTRVLAFSPDGRTLATGGGRNPGLSLPPSAEIDFSVRLWETVNGRERACFTGHRDSLARVRFSPDGRLLESVDQANTTTLWETASGKQHKHWPGSPEWLPTLAFSPDGRSLLWTTRDGLLHEEEIGTGIERHRWLTVDRDPGRIDFTPDGRSLVIRGDGLSVWDFAQGTRRHSFRGHGSPLRQLVFAPDGKTIASWGRNKVLWLWDAATGRPLLPAEGSSIRVERFGFMADGRSLATLGTDAVVRLWDTKGQKSGEFSLGTEKTLDLWRECLNTTNFLPLEDYPDHCVVFGPGRRTLAVVSAQRTIDLWDVATGKQLRQLTDLVGLPREMVFSADGKLLAVREGGKAVRIWDVATGAARFRIEQTNDNPGTFAFAPDGKLLAWNTGPTIHLTDLTTGKDVRELFADDERVRGLAFSGDGGQVAATGDKVVRLWQVATGKELRKLSGKPDEFSSVDLSTAPDGSLMARVSLDSKNSNWDLRHVATGRTLLPYMWHHSPFTFSADGRTVVTATHTVDFHDTATGRVLGELKTRQRGLVSALAFSPDGRIVATGSGDGTILLWDWRRACGIKEDGAPKRER